MTVNTVDAENGPWILACEHCNWTSVDIGIIFEKPHGIHSQLTKIRQSTSRTALPQHTATAEGSTQTPPLLDPDAHYASLKSFYAAQLSKASSTNPILSPTSNINYDSPSSLARILSLYTNPSSHKKNAGKPAVMQEATLTEGRGLISPASEVAVIQQLQSSGWSETTNLAQRTTQDHSPRFLSQLLPVPTLLVTKRSRRCRACRHILVKPEPKPQSTRYKIKLVAINYIPNMSLKPLSLPSTTASVSANPTSISSTSQPPAPDHDLSALPPSKPIQFLLHVQNPLFDAVKVTLATPTYTPGKHSSKVTILCPQFEVGANTDVWDEALGDGKSGRGTGPDSKRASKLPSGSKGAQAAGDSEGKVAEAGKVWERGRNWTSVVVEVVCARITEEVDNEDADLLEIPVFVRLEYDADVAAEGGGKGLGETGEKKERREVSYWCVLGVGRISRVVV
jgi:dynactin-4